MENGKWLILGCFALLATLVASCLGVDSEENGACVSEMVEVGDWLKQYCYSDFSQDDCSSHSRQDVNGSKTWRFYSGQTCQARGLDEGSN